MPVWIASYRYNQKVYNFMVNGETGRVQGEAPISWWKVALAVLVTLAPTGELQAQSGWYAGGNIGLASAGYDEADLVSDLAARGWSIDTPAVDDSDTAWKLYGGFAFNPVLAVEVGYVELGEVVTEFGATISPSDIDDLLADTYAVHPVLGEGVAQRPDQLADEHGLGRDVVGLQGTEDRPRGQHARVHGVVDALQRLPAADPERRGALFCTADTRAHLRQRLGDPAHRPGHQGTVTDQFDIESLTGQQAA